LKNNENLYICTNIGTTFAPHLHLHLHHRESACGPNGSSVRTEYILYPTQNIENILGPTDIFLFQQKIFCRLDWTCTITFTEH
jgi:hypothetical protein